MKKRTRRYTEASTVFFCALSTITCLSLRALTRINWHTKELSGWVQAQKKMHTRGEKDYNTHAMSLRLVEGGLARVAGQSCLAGPSVS